MEPFEYVSKELRRDSPYSQLQKSPDHLVAQRLSMLNHSRFDKNSHVLPPSVAAPLSLLLEVGSWSRAGAGSFFWHVLAPATKALAASLAALQLAAATPNILYSCVEHSDSMEVARDDDSCRARTSAVCATIDAMCADHGLRVTVSRSGYDTFDLLATLFPKTVQVMDHLTDPEAALAKAELSKVDVLSPFLLWNSPKDLGTESHYFWHNEHGVAAMPWVVPHGVDADALFHHGCTGYSAFPALNFPLVRPLRKAAWAPGRTLVVVATHSDQWGSDGATRHMSVVYGLNRQGEPVCEVDPVALGSGFARRILCPHPNVDSSSITRSFHEAGWEIGRGKFSKTPRRYTEWAALADVVLVEGGATMTHLLASSVALDVRCVRTRHRMVRATELGGLVADEKVCPLVWAYPTGDHPRAVDINTQVVNEMLDADPDDLNTRLTKRSTWRAAGG